MLRSVIDGLGNQAILGGINPLKQSQRSADPVVGLDTEYDSKTRRLICYQLAGETEEGSWGELYSGKLGVEELARHLTRRYPHARAFWLITYWSLAELQFLPVLSESFDWALYGTGSFDCSFCSSTGVELRVFDISRFFERASLGKVAESFGLRKLEYDRTRITRADLSNPRFRTYAINDARLCFQIVEALRAQFVEHGSDPLISKTAAGSTATVFRHRFIDAPIKTETPRARLAGLLSCWGGRAEALERGKFDSVYEYDLTSAYPNSVLSIKRFPTGADLREKKEVKALLKTTGFGRVIFKYKRPTHIPALPVVTQFAQVYPLSGQSWATTFEIRRALEGGAQVDLMEGWGYTGGSTQLYDMMQWALEMRRNSTGARSIAAKLMANSLIGKLAQRRGGIDVERMRAFCAEEGIPLADAIQLSSEELKALGLERPNKVGTCFMPEWNSLITGHTRAELHKILCTSDPVYCATDSVWSKTPIRKPPANLGLKRTGPGAVVRTRFGAIFPPGENPHLAHHSIWNREAGLKLIEDLGTPKEGERKYKIRRAIKLRESIRTKVRIATFVEEVRKGNTNWDGKRRLNLDGSTEPWQSVDQYLQWRKSNAASRASSRN